MILVPKPHKLETKEGKLEVREFKVCTDNEAIKFFDCFGGGDMPLNVKKADYDDAEKYDITIDAEGITVCYGDVAAAYRAYTTLTQILASEEVPYLTIEDWPDLANRGYMIDISRGKIPGIEYLKELAEILADLKYNQLQLYMDSFVYEYAGFEEYWRDTQPLTKAEIMELDAFCKERFIELVPIQNSFGHMGAWTAKPEIAPLAITDAKGKPSQTLNPLLPESLELIDRIYAGMLDAFSSDILNIGMDEPHELGMNETEEVCKEKGVGRVYTEHLNKVIDLARDKYGKKVMFFDDIVFKHPEELANIPKDAVVMQWGYEGEQHFDRNMALLKSHGLKFYVCPGTSMWGSLVGRMNNAILNITQAAESANYYGAEGFLLTEWGDDGHPQFPAITYLPLCVGGYASWNCGDHATEVNYQERRELLTTVKKYLDKFIYNCTGEKSLGDVVYRMGNAYILEELMFNGTQLVQCITRRYELTPERLEGFERIAKFGREMRAELDEVKADKIMLDECKANCDILILCCDLLLGRATKEDHDRVMGEFHRLWELKNHSVGQEIFADIVKSHLPK